MTTRKQMLGRDLATTLDGITPPQEQFIGAEQKRLYEQEEKRNDAINACAKEWARIFKVDGADLW